MKRPSLISGLTLLMAISALLSVATELVAAEDDLISMTRGELQAEREQIARNAMDLDESEAEAFWPLYRDWRAKMAGLGDRKVILVRQIMDEYDMLTESEAKEALDAWIALLEDELKLKKQYVKRFRRILSEKKVARFMHLENKIDAALAYNLAATLPLIE